MSDGTVTKVSNRYLDLTADQWTFCKQLIPILKPFDVNTTFLSYDENVLVSFVLPILNGLKDSLMQIDSKTEQHLPAVNRFQEIVLAVIEQIWDFTSP